MGSFGSCTWGHAHALVRMASMHASAISSGRIMRSGCSSLKPADIEVFTMPVRHITQKIMVIIRGQKQQVSLRHEGTSVPTKQAYTTYTRCTASPQLEDSVACSRKAVIMIVKSEGIYQASAAYLAMGNPSKSPLSNISDTCSRWAFNVWLKGIRLLPRRANPTFDGHLIMPRSIGFSLSTGKSFSVGFMQF